MGGEIYNEGTTEGDIRQIKAQRAVVKEHVQNRCTKMTQIRVKVTENINYYKNLSFLQIGILSFFTNKSHIVFSLCKCEKVIVSL